MKPAAQSLFAALLLGLCAMPSAHAVEGNWTKGAQASARLVAAGVDANGRLQAGIEIVMPEGWHTYWRAPGDAGIAPTFDFSASTNAGSADVAFPIPTRLDDGFAVTNVYKGRVLLPVSLAVPDVSKPVDLSVDLAIGVCAEICIPDDLTLTLAVEAGEHDAALEAELASVRSLLPAQPEPGMFQVQSASREGGSDRKPVFRLTATVPDPADAVLFIEGPHDWAPYAPVRVDDKGAAVWTVKFSRRGAETPINGAELRATIVSGGRAIEQTVAVD